MEYLQPKISATRLPAIQGEESWRSYNVENLLLESITMDVKGASRLGDGGESGGLKIAVGGITAKLGTFDWTFDKASFPKMAFVESGSDSDDEEVPRMGSMAAASASVPTDAQRDITSPTDGVNCGAMSDATPLEKWQVCALCPAVPCCALLCPSRVLL